MLLGRALLLSTSLLLMIVSYPGSSFSLLVCIAVAPALVATAKLNALQAALALGAWAWLWWLAALWWASSSLTAFSQSSMAVSLLLVALVCLSLALPYALSAFLIAYLKLWQRPLGLLQIPLCFAVLTSLLSGVLPASPVNALFEYPILLQWADVGGLPLLVFFYFAFNTAIASVFIHKQNTLKSSLGVVILIPLVILSYGYYKLSEEEPGPTQGITMAYIQPLASSEDKLSSLIVQTRKLNKMSDRIEVVVWPEVPVDFSWQDKPYERYRIKKLAQELDAHLIILPGYHYANAKNAEGGHFNSAEFISNEGENIAAYRKQRLVPFFEYLPFQAQLANYFPEVRNYVAGKAAVPFQYKDLTLAPLICYEALFSDLVRSYIDKGADLLINPGNDGWFGEAGALGHLSLGLIRTIEYRIPLVRVNNSGISTVINQKGELQFETLSRLDVQTESVFTLDVPNGKQTFFYQFGTRFHILSVVFLCLSLLASRRLSRERKA